MKPDPNETRQNDSHFGFRTVDASEKAGLVRGVFDRVAGSYDIMNDMMSGGVHRLWKDAMVAWLNPRPGQVFLDVAGGTGDIAFRILDRLSARAGDGWPDEAPGRMIVSDINRHMLLQGRDRARRRTGPAPDEWVCGDAQTLPLPSGSVDAYTIAFGIRNVTHVDKALEEAHRVLRPGGRFLCLEFSHPVVPGLDSAYNFYSFHVIPRMGQVIARDAESYRYLVESIRRFPDQARFKAMIEAAGFGQVAVRNLSGGIAALHSGWKL
ncbi:MAG: class I SAM-dependent methyltransferase [Alphaproteobacteria bacterium]